MQSRTVKTLNIVGGGSSGWMAAIYLNRYFNREVKNFQINVIESPDIGIIGVGEATVHSIRFFFGAMGLDEAELMAETNATIKSGIMFRNWMKPVAGKTHEYFHPFDQQQPGGSVDISSAWFVGGRQSQERYDEGVSVNSHLIKWGHCPKGGASPNYQAVVPYGYHLDATLLARFLRRKAVEQGVRHVEATVTDVEVVSGKILSVETDQGSFAGDFFLDCTGFRGFLIERLQQNNWESFADVLPCDKAVAIQRELPPGEKPRSYTVATALSSGWAWQIDLVNRQGSGYVYDSGRLSQQDAERELREFLGPESSVLKCTHLDMKVGCRRNAWVGNCAAIGLSGGFIEPLESTGLHMIHLGVSLLATHLAGDDGSDVMRDSYNEKMRGFYQDLKQFIVLHYCLSDRDDSEFWKAAPATLEGCAWLKSKLPLWKRKICEYQDFAGSYASIFTDTNYRYVLYGMQHYPAPQFTMSESEIEGIFLRFSQLLGRAKSGTLDHSQFLQSVHAKGHG